MRLFENNKAFRIGVYAAAIIAAAGVGVLLGQLASDYELRFLLNREFCGRYRGIEVYKSGEINDENVLGHIYVLDAAPSELTDCCKSLYFIGGELPIPKNETGHTQALGLTQGEKIYISTNSYSADVMLHELFHAYDNRYGNSSDKDFMSVYSREQTKLYVAGGYSDQRPSEYFATAGALYLLNPEDLLLLAPETYNYFCINVKFEEESS